MCRRENGRQTQPGQTKNYVDGEHTRVVKIGQCGGNKGRHKTETTGGTWRQQRKAQDRNYWRHVEATKEGTRQKLLAARGGNKGRHKTGTTGGNSSNPTMDGT